MAATAETAATAAFNGSFDDTNPTDFGFEDDPDGFVVVDHVKDGDHSPVEGGNPSPVLKAFPGLLFQFVCDKTATVAGATGQFFQDGAGATAQLIANGAGATAQLIANGAGATGQLFANGAEATSTAIVDAFETAQYAGRKTTAEMVCRQSMQGPTHNGNKYASYVIFDTQNPVSGTRVFDVETHNNTRYEFKICAEGPLNLQYYCKKVKGVFVEGGNILKHNTLLLNDCDDESMSVLYDVFKHYQASQNLAMI